MFADPDTLKAFFAIPKERIAHDLAHADANFDRLIQEIQASRAIPRKQRTPEIEAEEYHRQMLRGHALRSRPGLTEAQRLFFIVYPAEMIAENAMFAPHEQDRRAVLSQQMDAIKKREGLTEDQDYLIGEGPEDYQALSRESEELYDKVRDTVLVEVLRRYQINDVVRLFEEDRETFDQLMEEGRSAVLGS